MQEPQQRTDPRVVSPAMIDEAATTAARALKRLGVTGFSQRERTTSSGGKEYQLKGRVQRGRAHREFSSGWEPNIVAAAFELIAVIQASPANGRKPKPTPARGVGVEPMLRLPDVVGLAQQVQADLAEDDPSSD